MNHISVNDTGIQFFCQECQDIPQKEEMRKNWDFRPFWKMFSKPKQRSTHAQISPAPSQSVDRGEGTFVKTRSYFKLVWRKIPITWQYEQTTKWTNSRLKWRNEMLMSYSQHFSSSWSVWICQHTCTQLLLISGCRCCIYTLRTLYTQKTTKTGKNGQNSISTHTHFLSDNKVQDMFHARAITIILYKCKPYANPECYLVCKHFSGMNEKGFQTVHNCLEKVFYALIPSTQNPPCESVVTGAQSHPAFPQESLWRAPFDQRDDKGQRGRPSIV